MDEIAQMPEATEPNTPFRRLVLPALGLVLMGTVAAYAARSSASPISEQPVARHLNLTAMRHGGVALENLRNAEDRLDAVPVENSRGDAVGAVDQVIVDRGGRPALVRVSFGGFLGIGRETVPLKADTLGYDPSHNVVLTDLTVSELSVIAHQHRSQLD